MRVINVTYPFLITRTCSDGMSYFVPADGEVVYNVDTKEYRIGDGTTICSRLPLICSEFNLEGSIVSNPDEIELYINARLNEPKVYVDDLI